MGSSSLFHTGGHYGSAPAERARFIGIDLGTTNSVIVEIIGIPISHFQ